MSNSGPKARFGKNAKEQELLGIDRIFKELSSVVWSIDARTQQLLYWNEAAIALYERSPEEVTANPWLWRDAIASEDRHSVQQALQNIAALESVTLEYVILCPPQKAKRVSHRFWAIKTDEGEIQRIEGVIDVIQQSDRQLETLADNLPGVIYQYVTYPDGSNQFTYVSPASQKVMELTPEQMCQDSSVVWAQVHPEDLEGFQQSVIASAETLTHWQHQWRIITPSGRLKWMSGVAQPERGSQGEIIWDGVMFDISDRIVAKAALQDSEARYQSLINAMSEGIAVLTTDGTLQACNPSAERMLDVSEGIQGSSAFSEQWRVIDEKGVSVNPEDYPIVKALQNGQPVEKLLGVYKPDGGITWLSVNAQPMFREQEDRPYAAIASFTDITERQQAEHNLSQREQYLSALVRVQRYLLTLEGDRCEYDEILAYLGQASRASRVYVFETYTEGDRILCRQKAEWCAPEITSELDNPDLQHLDLGTTSPGWDTQLALGEVVATLTQDLPTQYQPSLISQNIQGVLLLPIHVNNVWFGFIGFDNCVEARLWETLEVNLLRAAADAIALWQESAMAEAALRASTHQLQRQAQREALLNRLARQIRNSLDLDTILDTAVREVQSLLRLDRASFSWYRPDFDPPCWEVVKQVRSDGLPGTMGRYSTDIIQSVTAKALQGIRQRIDNLDRYEDSALKTLLQRLGYTSYLAIPIQTQSGRIGLFSVGHCSGLRPWQDSEVELLEAVVSQLAIAIDQAQLYAQTQTKTQELEGALRELRRTQSQLIQTEKMSSLGQMVAGVAHEINNPVNFIYGNLSHVRSYCEDLLGLIALYGQTIDPKPIEIEAEITTIDLEFLQEDLPKILHSMQVGAERISTIVKSLRTFSRLDEADKKAVNLHENLDSALMILQNRLKAKPNRMAIELIKHYGNLPQVECYPGQLNQVFINLMANAIDALEDKCRQQPDFQPYLQVSTVLNDRDRVVICISDNGVGIPTDKLSRIFDPFYTTKPIGRGTGLGLSISYQIVVERHGGDLHAVSQVGEGTKFIIEIPY
ncbi:MAG: ATP-binding protein [Spirulinaceae cyanobacterium]